MRDHDDGWDDLVARCEIENITDAELRAAERALAALPAAAAEPIHTVAQGAIVGAALAAVPATRTRRAVGSSSRLARSVAGLVVLTAVTTLVVLWGGRDSFATLDYRTAIRILSRADQPPRHQGSAVGIVFRGVQKAIAALRRVAGQGDDEVAASAAKAALGALLSSVDGAGPDLASGSALDLDAAAARAATPGAAPERLAAVRDLANTALAGVLAIVSLSSADAQVQATRSASLRRLRLELSH